MLRGTKQQRKWMEQFAKEKNLRIVTMPFLETEYTVWYDMKFGDIKLWDASPDEFVSAIRYAEYVFTDSFHGMAFSCLYHVPFVAFPKEGKAQISRLRGLMDLLEINDRIANTYEEMETVISEDIDWNRVEDNLNRERDKSYRYLAGQLQGGR